MPNPNPDLAGLTEEEIKLDQLIEKIHHRVDVDFEAGREIDCATVQCVIDRVYQYRDSLIESRATAERRLKLLKELEWLNDNHTDQTKRVHTRCRICGNPQAWGHLKDCALAAELRGGGDSFDPDNIPDLPEPDRSVSIDEFENSEEDE